MENKDNKTTWISVKESLPEESGNYLVYDDDGSYAVGYFTAMKSIWGVFAFGWDDWDVKYWAKFDKHEKDTD